MAKTFEQVLAEVNQIMCEVFENDSIKLTYETTSRDVKEWDSLKAAVSDLS